MTVLYYLLSNERSVLRIIVYDVVPVPEVRWVLCCMGGRALLWGKCAWVMACVTESSMSDVCLAAQVMKHSIFEVSCTGA